MPVNRLDVATVFSMRVLSSVMMVMMTMTMDATGTVERENSAKNLKVTLGFFATLLALGTVLNSAFIYIPGGSQMVMVENFSR